PLPLSPTLFPYTTLLRSAWLSAERFKFPCSFRDFRYSICPAWPCAIHSGKYSSSGKTSSSRTEATPHSSKPISSARTLICSVKRSEEHTSELQSPDHLVC